MYTMKNSFEFAKKIADQDAGLFMASLDVFTNIPLEETISVCCYSLFSNDSKVNNINRIDFEEQLYKTAFSISKENFINKLMELLWDLL